MNNNGITQKKQKGKKKKDPTGAKAPKEWRRDYLPFFYFDDEW